MPRTKKLTDEFAVTSIEVKREPKKAEEPKKNVILGSEATPESKKDSGQARMTKAAPKVEPKKEVEEAKGKPRSKKYIEKQEMVERTKLYSLNDAVELVQQVSYTKFPSTVEIHINTTVPNVRGLVTMPYASGEALKVLAFGNGAEESGADIVGSDEVLDTINKGKIEFDILVATPQWMPKLAKVARILGPRGLMPNPKAGTVTDNLKKAVEDLKGGKTEYKTEPKGQVIHLSVGKIDQSKDEISANIKALYNTIGRSRIKKITLAPTMGPGVRINISSI